MDAGRTKISLDEARHSSILGISVNYFIRGLVKITKLSKAAAVKVADEVWIAAALLHQEHPEAQDFSIEEIVDRARREALHEPLRPGVYVHVVWHCVANRPPYSGRYRMLFETADGRRRLFRIGDAYHPDREGSKTIPNATDLPPGYGRLLNWYCDWSRELTSNLVENDPLLKAQGSGKHLWADEPADEYVRRLREGWE